MKPKSFLLLILLLMAALSVASMEKVMFNQESFGEWDKYLYSIVHSNISEGEHLLVFIYTHGCSTTSGIIEHIGEIDTSKTVKVIVLETYVLAYEAFVKKYDLGGVANTYIDNEIIAIRKGLIDKVPTFVEIKKKGDSILSVRKMNY